jgi:DivIVA domain-containing protein
VVVTWRAPAHRTRFDKARRGYDCGQVDAHLDKLDGRNPTALAELAKGRARTRRADLEQALRGRFTDHHAQLARMLLGQLDELTARITQVADLLDAAIRALPAPTTTTATTTMTASHPSIQSHRR